MAQPRVFAALDPTSGQQVWLVDSYTLGVVGGLTAVGVVISRFGPRRVLRAGLTIYVVSACLAAVSSTAPALIVARAGTGVATGSIITAALAGLAAGEGRRHGITSWAVCVAAGGILGRIAAGLLLGAYWWGSVFVAAAAVGLLLQGPVSLAPRARTDGRAPQSLTTAAVRTLSLLATTLAVVQSPTHGWLAPEQIALLGSSIIAVAVMHYALRGERALIPVHALASAGAVAALAASSFMLFGMYFVLTQLWQSVRGNSPTEAAVLQTPIAIAMVGAAAVSTRRARDSRSLLQPVVGAVAMGAGFVIVLGANADSAFWRLAAGMILVGVAGGLLVPFATAQLLARSRTPLGVAASYVDLIREIGGAIGIALIGGGVAARYRQNVASLGLPPSLRLSAGKSLPSGLRAIDRSLTGSERTHYEALLKSAFVRAVHDLVGVGVFVGVALAMVLTAVHVATRDNHQALSTLNDSPEMLTEPRHL